MKYLLFILFPVFSSAQITVVKKPVKIVTIGSGAWSSSLSRTVIDEDTTYQYIFRDNYYSEIIVMKSIVFDKDKLKEFAKALKTSVDGDWSNQVWIDRIGITKEKGMLGSSGYTIYYDRAAGYVKPKDIEKLISAINAE